MSNHGHTVVNYGSILGGFHKWAYLPRAGWFHGKSPWWFRATPVLVTGSRLPLSSRWSAQGSQREAHQLSVHLPPFTAPSKQAFAFLRWILLCLASFVGTTVDKHALKLNFGTVRISYNLWFHDVSYLFISFHIFSYLFISFHIFSYLFISFHICSYLFIIVISCHIFDTIIKLPYPISWLDIFHDCHILSHLFHR